MAQIFRKTPIKENPSVVSAQTFFAFRKVPRETQAFP